eukprot:TRINITY_DN6810_c0_g2_i2.p1 TRINITY_DN6810_c0_g2~~TRINITY_DN6810_c0_g2_i2.p1  ORF type:complete len:429 (-),score=38.59 TRINITY_DN6810_c0_g2_i2:77-1363(-)
MQRFIYTVDYSLATALLISSRPGEVPLADTNSRSASGIRRGEAYRYGYLRLQQLLEEYCTGLDWNGAPIDAHVTSVGGGGIGNWATEFTNAALYPNDSHLSSRSSNLERLRVFFPSRSEADQMDDKYKRQYMHHYYWDSRRFLRNRLYHSNPITNSSFTNILDVSKPQPSMFWHSKVLTRILAHPTEHDSASSDGKKMHGWVYIGGHNLSGSAWGSVYAEHGVLRMRNYELGVLIVSVPPSLKAASKRDRVLVTDLTCYQQSLPWKLALSPSEAEAQKYASTDRPHPGGSDFKDRHEEVVVIKAKIIDTRSFEWVKMQVTSATSQRQLLGNELSLSRQTIRACGIRDDDPLLRQRGTELDLEIVPHHKIPNKWLPVWILGGHTSNNNRDHNGYFPARSDDRSRQRPQHRYNKEADDAPWERRSRGSGH